MNHESHDSNAIHTIHGAIQGIKRYKNQYVSCNVIFETNHDTYRTIHTILTTMLYMQATPNYISTSTDTPNDISTITTTIWSHPNDTSSS